MRSVSDQCRDPEVEDILDPLAAIGEAARVLLEDHTAAVRRVGAWLLAGGGGGDLFAFITGSDGARDHTAAIIARRDELLRQAAATIAVKTLAAELARYAAGAWLRDRVKVSNPYQPDDRRAVYFEVLRLRAHAPGERQLRRIVTSTPC